MKRRGFIQALFAGIGAAVLPKIEPETTPVKPIKKQMVTVQGEKFPEAGFAESGPTGNYKFEDPVIWVNGEPVIYDQNATAQEIAKAINKNKRLAARADIDEHGIITLTSKMDKF